jgi:hypothetical protein
VPIKGGKNLMIRRQISFLLIGVGISSVFLGLAFLLPEIHGLAQPSPCYNKLPVNGDEVNQVRDAVEVSRITFFPFGLDCTWGWPGGAKEEQFFWDWRLNAMLYGGATLGVIGAALLLLPRRKDSST